MRIIKEKLGLMVFLSALVLSVVFLCRAYLPAEQVRRTLFFDQFQKAISKIKTGSKRADVERILDKAQPSIFVKFFSFIFLKNGGILTNPSGICASSSGYQWCHCQGVKECSYAVTYYNHLSWNLFLKVLDVVVLYKERNRGIKCKPCEYRDMGKYPFQAKSGSVGDDEVVGLYIYDGGKNKFKECSPHFFGNSYDFKEIICGERASKVDPSCS